MGDKLEGEDVDIKKDDTSYELALVPDYKR